MLNFTVTESTPANMLRAIKAACDELLGETRPAGEHERPHAVSADEKAAQHVTEANRLNAAANSELDQAAASLSAHNVAEAFNQTSGPSIENLQASGQLMNVRVEHQDEAHLDLKLETDSTGAEWNTELHASTKTKNADGTWKKRRNTGRPLTDAVAGIEEATGEPVKIAPVNVEALTQGFGVPVPPAPAPTFPPLPPAAPLVTMNDIYALIQTGKCVLNDVIAGAQAKGFADVGAFSRDATPEQRAELLKGLTA